MHVSGMAGMTVVFRSGTATVTEGLSGPMKFECWIAGGHTSLYKPGSGSNQAQGAIKKMGTEETELFKKSDNIASLPAHTDRAQRKSLPLAFIDERKGWSPLETERHRCSPGWASRRRRARAEPV